jgi:hypothetical protein
MPHETDLIHVMTFCGECSCGCPELFLEPAAPDERRVVLTDDFGQRIQMSLDQLRVIVEQARSGALDDALLAVL